MKLFKLIKKIIIRLNSIFESLFFEKLIAEFLFPIYSRIAFPERQNLPPEPSNVNAILVWNIDSLGDSLWITPTLRAIRSGYSSAKITLVCNKSVYDIFETNPNIDELIPIKANDFYSARGYFRKIPELKGRSFDIMLVLEMGSRPADKGRLIGREIKVGYIVSNDLGLLKKLPDYTLPPNLSKEYWPCYFLHTAEHLGLPSPLPKLEIYPTSEDLKIAQEMLKDWLIFNPKDTPIIGMHPCVAPYANLTKKWPKNHFIDLAIEISLHHDVFFVITGFKDEYQECQEIATAIRDKTGKNNVYVAAGELKVREMASLIQNLTVMVIADTSILHLSAAIGTPVVALFGATEPKTIAPPIDNCFVITENLPCSPCHQTRDCMPFWPKCIYDQPQCMYRISAKKVADVVSEILKLKKRGGISV